ncbi:HTH_Tnp_Tc3_2 domain-containing protein [Trichonephila clavipes]|nr:HTH_Tnp_Tc3_2 domain-containing protein [Trichonephila clavipes]
MTFHCKSRFKKSVNPETVRIVFRKHKYYGRVPQGKPYISKANRQARLTFAKMYVRQPTEYWENIIFAYESKYNIFGSDGKQKVWWKSNTAMHVKNLQPTVKYGKDNVSVLVLEPIYQQEMLNSFTKIRWFNKLHHIPKWPRDRAVAYFRIVTGHDCLSKYLNMIGIAQSPLCKLCDSMKKWPPFIWNAAVHSALDPRGADIGRPDTKCVIYRLYQRWRTSGT